MKRNVACILVLVGSSLLVGFGWSGATLLTEETGAYYRKDTHLAGTQASQLRYRFEGFPEGGHTYMGFQVGGGYLEIGYSAGRGGTGQPHIRAHDFQIKLDRSEITIRDEGLRDINSRKAQFEPGRSGYIDLPFPIKERMRIVAGDTVEQTMSGTNPLLNTFKITHANGSRTFVQWIIRFNSIDPFPASGGWGARYRVILSTARNPSQSLTASDRSLRASELSHRLDSIEVETVNAQP